MTSTTPEPTERGRKIARPLTDHLRNGKNWLNGGACCGQVDSTGTCAAPACVFGEALKWFYEAADEIDHQAALRHKAESSIAQAHAEEQERCARVAELRSTKLPHDSDFTRGYAEGRAAAGLAIRESRP